MRCYFCEFKVQEHDNSILVGVVDQNIVPERWSARFLSHDSCFFEESGFPPLSDARHCIFCNIDTMFLNKHPIVLKSQIGNSMSTAVGWFGTKEFYQWICEKCWAIRGIDLDDI